MLCNFLVNGVHILTPLLYLWSTLISSTVSQQCSFCDVENLVAEADYRAVKLRWKYNNIPEPPAFKVSFCEISIWNSKVRCREKLLQLSTSPKYLTEAQIKRLQSKAMANNLDKLIRIERGNYEAAIYDLRMLTNYTFAVEAEFNPNLHQRPPPPLPPPPPHPPHPVFGDSFAFASPSYNKFGVNRPLSADEFQEKGNNVSIETKGFSARTSLCFANISEVIVNTGPFFNGKIAVENAGDSKCAVYGNQSDPRDTYKLTIIHELCGSKTINYSRIESMIIVHENKEILTHNSRRFLVVCSFPPESYTLKASVAMPPHLIKRKKSQELDQNRVSPDNSLAPNEDRNYIHSYEPYKMNSVKDSRILALQQQHKILDAIRESHHDYNNVVVFVVLVVSLGSCLLAVFWYWGQNAVETEAIDNKLNHQKKEMTKDKRQLTVNPIKDPSVSLAPIQSLGESYA